MGSGQCGQTGQIAVPHVGMGHNCGRGHVLHQPLNMGARTALDVAGKFKIASLVTALCIVSGWSSQSGRLATLFVMEALPLASEALCQHFMVGMTVLETSWRWFLATYMHVQVRDCLSNLTSIAS